MRIVAVSRLAEGMELADSVYLARGGVRIALLRKGTRITTSIKDGLRRAGIFAVHIEDRVSEGIAPSRPISTETRNHAAKALTEALGAARAGGRTKVSAEQIECIDGVVAAMVEEVRGFAGALSSLADLQSFDAYTLEHSINVCVIGLMIGDEALRRHGWRDHRGVTHRGNDATQLRKLGLGLLLHDIGKVVVPESVLTKPGPLTDDEMDLVRRHPEAGLRLIDDQALSALSRVVIGDHHERIDGRGYPKGKADDQIHQNARIASIADIYDAVAAERTYARRQPTHEAFELVMGLAGSALDHGLVQLFTQVVAPYPEGTAVVLSDGMRGLVAKNHRGHTTRPRVRVTNDPAGHPVQPCEIELVETPSLTILDSVADPGDPAAEEPRPEVPHLATANGPRAAGILA